MKLKKEYITVVNGVARIGFQPNGNVNSYFAFTCNKNGFTLERTDVWDEDKNFMLIDDYTPQVRIPKAILNAYFINEEYDKLPAIREGDGKLNFLIPAQERVPVPSKIVHQEAYFPYVDYITPKTVYAFTGGTFVTAKWPEVLVSVYMDKQAFIRVEEAKPEHAHIAEYEELEEHYGIGLAKLKAHQNICFRYTLKGKMRIPFTGPFRNMLKIRNGDVLWLYECPNDEFIITPPVTICETCGKEIHYEEELPVDMLASHEAKARANDLSEMMEKLSMLEKMVVELESQKQAAEERATLAETKNAQVAELLQRVAAL